MDLAELHITTRQDIANSVRGECGEHICSEVACVIATAPNGQRWAHPDRFMVVEIKYDDEFPFARADKAAENVLDRLLSRVQAQQAAGTLTLDDWTEIDPVYGSESWGSEDEWRLAQLEKDEYP